METNGSKNLLVDFFLREPEHLYRLYSGKRIPKEDKNYNYFLKYNAIGLAGICFEWLKNDETMPVEEFVQIIKKLYGYKQLEMFFE